MCTLTLQVIEVKASVRTGKDDFVLSLRKSLKDFYGDKVVGLGGVFLIEKGSAHIHIMVGKVGLSFGSILHKHAYTIYCSYYGCKN